MTWSRDGIGKHANLIFRRHLPPLNPYSLFELYYPLKIIDSIVDATNSYDRAVGSGPEARGKDWYDTNRQEIYLYLAIRIYMMIVILNEIEDYWVASPMRPIHPVCKYLSRKRYEELHIRFRLGPRKETTYSRVY